MNKSNSLQYEMMISLIDSYEKTKSGLGTLVDGLEGLLNATDGPSSSWRITFLGYWGKLEDVRALSLDQDKLPNSPEDHVVIADSLAHIKLMILNEMN